jgi:hypothetical protein
MNPSEARQNKKTSIFPAVGIDTLSSKREYWSRIPFDREEALAGALRWASSTEWSQKVPPSLRQARFYIRFRNTARGN